MIHFSAWALNNPYTLSILCLSLVFVPVLGMWAVHKYGWQHWEPFSKTHKWKKTKEESSTKDSGKGLSNLGCSIYLKNHVHCMKMMKMKNRKLLSAKTYELYFTFLPLTISPIAVTGPVVASITWCLYKEWGVTISGWLWNNLK